MKLNLVSEVEDKLFGRKVLVYETSNKGTTPSRLELQKQIGVLNKTKPELVTVTKIEGKYGKTEFIISVSVYNSEADYKMFVSKSMSKKSEIKEEKAAEEQAA